MDSSGDGTGSKLTAVAVAVLALLFLLDFVVLKGDPVARVTTQLGGTRPAAFTVARVGEPHLVEIRTHRRVGGEDRGRKVSWRLLSPDGIAIREDEELLDHTERHFRFQPNMAGEYRIYVEDNGLLMRSGSASAHVTVTVNDRRFLKRFGISL